MLTQKQRHKFEKIFFLIKSIKRHRKIKNKSNDNGAVHSEIVNKSLYIEINTIKYFKYEKSCLRLLAETKYLRKYLYF